MNFKNIIIAITLILMFSITTFAQEVNIVLKNSKVIVGRILEEKPDYILLDYELGQLKVDRQNIESISYNPFINLGLKNDTAETKINNDDSKGYKFTIKDPVVVYLRNGSVVAGLLLAKSLNMIMLQTESGNLTIPKADLLKIEYVSSEYAERGEVVVAHLNNGQTFEGNVYFEDSKDFTLDTELGRLTIPKNKLRTIEYTGKSGGAETTIAEQYTNITLNKRRILPRYDVLDIGYTTKLGTSFGSGFGIGYQSRFSVSEFEGLNLSAVAGLSLNYFSLNKDNILSQNQSLGANLKGGAFITTIGAGGQINIYPQTASFYDIYLSPVLEGHFIYNKLEQAYPSYPQLNTSETTSELKFGIGMKFGVEFLFDTYRIGIHYNMHYIFGSDGFNQVSLTFVKPLF